MIIDGILFLINQILSGMVSLLPTSSGFPSQVDNAINNVAGYIHTWDDLVPSDDIFDAILFLISINIAIFSVWGTLWVFKYIRGN